MIFLLQSHFTVEPSEALAVVLMFIYVMGVLELTRKLYGALRNRGLSHNVVVYYNRKIIHVLAGGVVAFLVPYVFKSPVVPFILAIVLAVLVYIPHITGKLMYWFQVEDNMYEVNFCIIWGLTVLILWITLGNPRYAVIPPLFMSIGDAVTGIVRNALYGRRTKSWVGNIAMLAVTSVIGYTYIGPVGLVASIVASIVEHYEIPPFFDDNVLISLSTTTVLIASRVLGLT